MNSGEKNDVVKICHDTGDCDKDNYVNSSQINVQVNTPYHF